MSGREPPAPPRTAIWNGSEGPLPDRAALRAGPVDLIFESGELRSIRVGNREVVRRIYAAVRDRNWGTVRPRISNLRSSAGEDAFDLEFDVECLEREIDFVWKGRARGGPDGTIRFSFDGEARSTFLRNRIGFCVLHPAHDCAGARVRVVGADGSTVEGAFPREVSPTAPFQEIASIAHEAAPGLWVELRFEGDVFEMEDQRNWLDGSFKTFSTPLRIPYPVEVAAGTRVSQAVVLSLRGNPPARRSPSARRPGVVCQVPRGAGKPLPAIGLGTAGHGRPLEPEETARLRDLRLSHLRVDLPLSSESSIEALERATGEARALGTKLEAAILLEEDPDTELERLARAVRDLAPPVRAWLVFHRGERATTARWARLARERLGGLAPGALFGGGTDNDFAELNRERPPVEDLDLVSFACNPQVHLFDDSTLIESLETHGHALSSLRAFSGKLPLAVSPVTLRPRFAVNATGPVAATSSEELPFEVDPRQMSLFGAGWTLASIGSFAEGGASSLTYFETTGWKGVMETRAGSPLPGKFRSVPGAVFPLYHVLLDLAEHAGARIAPAGSSAPARVAAFVLEEDGRRTLLLANLTAERQEVEARGVPEEVRVRRLDETNALDAMTRPAAHRQSAETARAPEGVLRLELLPFSLARVDATGRR